MNKIVCCLIIKLIFVSGSFSMENEKKAIEIPKVADTFLNFYYKYTGEKEVSITAYNTSQWQILYFISKDDKEELVKILENGTYKLENLDQKILGMGVTMMHAAAYYNSIKIIGWLVINEADLNPKDRYSRTPHDVAILFNQINAATLIQKSIELRLRKANQKKANCVIL